jgi:hypothetical protein
MSMTRTFTAVYQAADEARENLREAVEMILDVNSELARAEVRAGR